MPPNPSAIGCVKYLVKAAPVERARPALRTRVEVDDLLSYIDLMLSQPEDPEASPPPPDVRWGEAGGPEAETLLLYEGEQVVAKAEWKKSIDLAFFLRTLRGRICAQDYPVDVAGKLALLLRRRVYLVLDGGMHLLPDAREYQWINRRLLALGLKGIFSIPCNETGFYYQPPLGGPTPAMRIRSLSSLRDLKFYLAWASRTLADLRLDFGEVRVRRSTHELVDVLGQLAEETCLFREQCR